MERFGFVGLPNAGKSSLFNALAGGGALAAPYAFATKDPNVGVAKVPDPRLDALAAMSHSRNVVPAAVQFVDIGGLVEGASKGEGLGNRFLGGIREVDAIVLVLRAFDDPDVPGPDDPLEHLRIVELELALADLETVEGRRGQRRRRRPSADRSLAEEVAALEAAYAALAEGPPIYRAGLDATARAALSSQFLLTNKPVLAVVNVGEGELDRIPELEATVAAELAGRRRARHVRAARGRGRSSSTTTSGPRCSTPSGSAKARCPASSAPPTTCSACAPSSRPARRRAGRGRSAPVPRPPSAPASSTATFERGFIRAEVIHWDELLDIGSWAKAREHGQAPHRGQGLRGRRRRRARDPLQRVAGLC